MVCDVFSDLLITLNRIYLRNLPQYYEVKCYSLQLSLLLLQLFHNCLVQPHNYPFENGLENSRNVSQFVAYLPSLLGNGT